MDVPAVPLTSAQNPQRCRPPSPKRFRAIYDAHFEFVWRVVVRLGVPPDEAEDAVQDVFVVAYRRWSTFAGRSSLRTWLFAIARRVASHERRARFRRTRRTQAFGLTAATIHDGEGQAERRHARTQLSSFLADLDPAKRDVFILADLEGFTGREVAETLGIKPNTAWSRLKAARAEFSRTFGATVRKQTVAAERSAKPPAAASSRVWAVMLPQLPWGAKAAAGSTAGAGLLKTWVVGANLKLFGATVGVGVTAVAAASVAVPEPPKKAPTAAASVAPKGKAKRTRARKKKTPPPAPVVHARTTPEPEPVPEPFADVPVQRPAVMPTPAELPKRRRAKAKRMPADDTASDAQKPRPINDPLAGDVSALDFDEVELIHKARGALREGQARRALLLVEEHGRRFPKSKLSLLRKMIRIESLCKADKRPQGIGEAAALLKRRNDPKLRQRIQVACGLVRKRLPNPLKVAMAED